MASVILDLDLSNPVKLDAHEKWVNFLNEIKTQTIKEFNSLVDKNIYIKMNQNCESLNVAVSGSIILYELNK